jgi:hypothetical protein
MSKPDPVDSTFKDVLELFSERGTENAHKDVPAKVLAYDPTTQTVDVQPLIMVSKNGALRPLSIARQVQVRWPAGATWSVVGELVAGDFGWLVPAAGDISAWKMQGTEQDPTAIQRKDTMSDVRFEPGSQPVSTPLAADAYKAGALVIKAAELLLGDSAATDKVALDSLVRAAIQVVYDHIDGHIHTTPSGNSGVPTVLLAPSVPANVGATKVKGI